WSSCSRSPVEPETPFELAPQAVAAGGPGTGIALLGHPVCAPRHRDDPHGPAGGAIVRCGSGLGHDPGDLPPGVRHISIPVTFVPSLTPWILARAAALHSDEEVVEFGTKRWTR